MKIEDFKHFLTKLNENWSDVDDMDDDDLGEYNGDFDTDEEYDGRYEEEADPTPDDDDAIGNLQYLLRQLFKNSGIVGVTVTGDSFDINMYVPLQRRDSLSYILKVFEVVTKIKKDILPQYDSEIDLWRTKKFEPILTFSFNYNEGLDDDSVPF